MRSMLARTTRATSLMGVRKSSTVPPVVKPLALLTYEYIDEMGEHRAPHRGAHLAHATAAAERGDLLLGGALVELDGGVMVFTCPDKASEFARTDPYILNDLVVGYSIRDWSVVVGSFYDLVE